MPDTPEILIDAFITNTTQDASDPRVVTLSDGSMLVAYATEEGGAPGFDIRGQLFDADGNPIGDEVQFDFDEPLNERNFDIVAAEGNRVALVVEIAGGNRRDLETEVFQVDETGVTDLDLGFVSRADDRRELLNPTIADVGNGDDFRIFFTQRIDVDESIFGQGLDDGVAFNLPLDRDYRGNANATLASDTLENGNIVVALDRDGFNGRDEQILVMIMTPGGNIVRQFNIGSSNDQQFQPVVTALTGGGFVVAFGENDGDRDPVFQVFAANGDAVSGLREYGTEAVAARSSNDDPAIAALEDGGFVAFYDDDIANQIRGQRFDAEGNEVGDEFVVANDAGSQLDATLLADGRVAISYFVPDEGVVKTAIVEGTPGQIILPGTIADDELTGTNAGETILGFGGADTIEGFGGADSIDGGNGNDQIDGGSGADTIDGGNGNDVIDGGGGWDTLNGGSGQDSLNGSFGSDILNGGAGNDILIGGGGRDDFVFAGNFGDDTITDFDARNNNEDIDLSGVDGIDSFADLAGALSQQGDDVVIDLAGGSITLENVALADLNANDFLF